MIIDEIRPLGIDFKNQQRMLLYLQSAAQKTAQINES